MGIKNILIIALCLVLFSGSLLAKKSTTFLKDGNVKYGVIEDMSSRNLRVEYLDGQKVHINRIWMINFMNQKWNFPKERALLNNKYDTIFLNNNKVIYRTIVDYSSRRHKFEFKNGGSVHVSNVKRIYVCCTTLPDTFKKQLAKKPKKSISVTVLQNGKKIKKTIQYMNSSKIGFTDGTKLNMSLVYMLILTNDKWDYLDDKQYIKAKYDSIFLKNGDVVYDIIYNYNKRRGTFTFRDIDPIDISEVQRIYFKKRLNNRNIKRKIRRKFNR